MAITDKKTGVWGLDQTYNKINQGSIWDYSEVFGLWTWGEGGNGGLGDSTRTHRSSPAQVPGGNWSGLWSGMSGSRNHVYAFQSANELWSWGSNTYGALAFGPGSPAHRRSSPVQVAGSWSNVSMGFYGGVAVKTSGGLYTWGYNADGSLGLGDGNSRSSPTQVGSDTTWKKDKYGCSWGGYAGGAIKTDGTLWMWGRNTEGVLGQGATNPGTNSPVQLGSDTDWDHISVGGGNGEEHACALRTDGSAYAWGENQYGQVGDNSTTTRNTAQQIPGTWARFSTSAGRFSFGVKTDGTLWTWGRNAHGWLGHNNTTNYSSPKQVGSGTDWSTNVTAHGERMAAIKTDGTLWTWGNCEEGALGDNTSVNKSSPVQIPGNWADVVCYGKGMAALKYI